MREASTRPPQDRIVRLPSRPTRLIGREREIAALRDLLLRDDIRLVTITGPPGVGKTRLAVEVAAELGSKFADGPIFVDLVPIRDPDLLPYAAAQQLGVREEDKEPGWTIADMLARYLADKRLLLLLDNFEQIASGAPLVGEWLAAAGGLKVLVTSRVPLHLLWEQEFPLDPLPLHKPSADTGALKASPAITLFAERARAVDPEFALGGERTALVSAVCARLDGLPLAIELAAARVKHLPLSALHEQLEHRLDLLTSGARDLPLRHQTLRQAIAWSYDLLNAQEQVLFRRAAVFAGGFSLDALSEVCAYDLTVPAFDAIASLVDKNLVRRTDAEPEARFHLLDSLREYGLERLKATVEAADIHTRHFEFYARLGKIVKSELISTEQLTWLHRLDDEFDNIRSALSWALEHRAEGCLELAADLREFWDIRGHFAEGRGWIERALASGRELPTALRARALGAAGRLANELGDSRAARVMFAESLSLARGLSDQILIADALFHLGLVTSGEGSYEAGEQLTREAIRTYRAREDTRFLAHAYFRLGWDVCYQGRLDEAEELFQESHRLARQSGDRPRIQFALNGLGIAAVSRKDYVAARRLWRERLALTRELQAPGWIASSLHNLGVLETYVGDYASAGSYLEEALAITRSAGSDSA